MVTSLTMSPRMEAQVMTNVVVLHDGFGSDDHGSLGTMRVKDLLVVVILEMGMSMTMMGLRIRAGR